MHIYFLLRRMLIPGFLLCAWGMTVSPMVSFPARAGQEVDRGQGDSDLAIESDAQLPETYPHAAYEFRFQARGGVPPLHWRLEKGCRRLKEVVLFQRWRRGNIVLLWRWRLGTVRRGSSSRPGFISRCATWY